MSIRSSRVAARWVAAIAAGLVMAGCGSQQEPATKALEAANRACGLR